MQRRRIYVLGTALVGLVSAVLVGGAPATASSAWRFFFDRTPVVPGSTYLALGDSITFGYREMNNLPYPTTSDYQTANFVGYPEDVAADLSLSVANAACSGETSTSLITGVAQDSYGCETGYRNYWPLHVAYSGSQLDYAKTFLGQNHKVRLVSLMIGVNDVLKCQATTPDGCASEMPAVLKTVATNIATILGQIRHEARYSGQIVIVNYYALNASDSSWMPTLDDTIDTAAKPFRVAIADGYAAFEGAAAQTGGDLCSAGLLTILTSSGCGLHPSLAGQQVLAGTVERAIRKG